MEKRAYKLLALAFLAFAIILTMATGCGKLKQSMNVTATWYQTNYENFDLIFVDRKGRIENIINQDPSITATSIKPEQDREIIIVKDKNTWRVAETLEESQNLEASSKDAAQVIKVSLSKIQIYKRTQH
jgi:hypothetical protein